eukprot:TRINITY_DN63295_c0_g1_i1.p1 TRINITY_DN63295_c0_g1~~TRINITY_DN63295_c0_g1_i1.p1  ORF type:complete len:958 (+),score=179.21 TRINITY_DN63295_c0_g1_i1:111-2876(+)
MAAAVAAAAAAPQPQLQPPPQSPLPPLVVGSTPVTLHGPKGGYLYVKVLEAGNLDALDSRGTCCGGPLGVGSCCVLSAGVPSQLRVTMMCTSLERVVSSTGAANADSKTHKAVFNEEILVRSLNYCGADTVDFKLQAKTATLAEASLPLRLALPPPLACCGAPPPPKSLAVPLGGISGRAVGAASVAVGGTSASVASSVGGVGAVAAASSGTSGRTVSGAAAEAATVTAEKAAAEALAAGPLEPHEWLPCQRVILRPPGASSASWPGGGGGSGSSSSDGKGSASLASIPYLDVQLLQLTDNSLPRLRGTSPMLLAIQRRQEQLVRALLGLDVFDTLSAVEKAACVMEAVECRSREIVTLLLEHVKPSHGHLLASIRLGAVELMEALLSVGGPPLLNPAGPRQQSSSSSTGARGNRGGGGGQRNAAVVAAAARRDDAAARVAAARAAATVLTRAPLQAPREELRLVDATQRERRPRLTPLALACSLGDIDVVEALCAWARREKAHVDPSAPLALGSGAQAASPNFSPWWDDRRGEDGWSCCYGDPPMIMAVRGLSPLAGKRQLIAALTKFGFSVDVRSPVDSWTPLLAAVEIGNLELVTTLVKHGARLSADRHLGFTPLHLACQTGHWHLVPCLTKTMRGQYDRVAAWGPSPQYVSLNVADAYGRTALDVALLRYFASALPPGAKDSQKAVDLLREFIHGSQAEDPGLVCGWEVLRVLRLLDALPSSKTAVGAQLFGPAAEWAEAATVGTSETSAVAVTGPPAPPPSSTKLKAVEASAKVSSLPESPQPAQCSDLEDLLQAVRVLVRAGAQTSMLQDLVQAPSKAPLPGSPEASSGGDGGGGSHCSFAHWKASRSASKPLVREHSPKYSPMDPEDWSEAGAEDDTTPAEPVSFRVEVGVMAPRRPQGATLPQPSPLQSPNRR